jgi:hypothetical protein
MAGKRNYWIASTRLFEASKRIWLGDKHLASCLQLSLSRSESYIPSKEPAYVLGQLERVFSTQYGIGLRLKYHDEPIWISQQTIDKARLDLIFGSADAPHLPRRYCFVLCRVSISAAGNLSCEDLGFLPLNQQFIPSYSDGEDNVLSSLIDADQRFYRCLPYDGSPAELPFIVLYDPAAPPRSVSLTELTASPPHSSTEQSSTTQSVPSG